MINVILVLAVALTARVISRILKTRKFIVKQFERCNIIVFGKKRTGKDLLFQFVVNKRDVPHYANIPYSAKTEIRSVKDFSCTPNTYKNFIDGTVKVIPKKNAERTDFYISDGGIILPSQYQGDLVKLYPSFPTYYALSGHLTDSNIHINTQVLSRVWDKLREQADGYFMTLNTLRSGRVFVTSLIYYDRYQSALDTLRPFPCSFFSSKEKKAMKADYDAKHGIVKHMLLFQVLPKSCYDTRYYHRVLYGEPAPKRKSRKEKQGAAEGRPSRGGGAPPPVSPGARASGQRGGTLILYR